MIIYKPSGVKDVNFTALEKQVNKVRVRLITNGVLLQFLRSPWNYLLIKHENTRAPKWPDCLLQQANRLKDTFSLSKSISNLCLLFNTILIFSPF